MNQCPYCKKEISNRAIICPHCGRNLIMPTVESAAIQGTIISAVTCVFYTAYAIYSFPSVLANPGNLAVALFMTFSFLWIIAYGGVLILKGGNRSFKLIMGLLYVVLAYLAFLILLGYLGINPF